MSTFVLLNGVTVVAKTLTDWPTLPKNHSWRNGEHLGVITIERNQNHVQNQL